MSYRYTRQQYLDEKRLQREDKVGFKPPKENPHQVVAYLNRVARRAAIASGLVDAIATWGWSTKVSSGTVEAHTRSEARARVKEALGLSRNKRLPDWVLLWKEQSSCLA